MDSLEIMKKLQEPFPVEDIEWRVGSTNADKTKGLALAYITNRAIQNRLDEIFGPFGWKNEYREWKNTSQLCGISIKVEGEWITKWDGADDSNTEATKGGLSDAMKRAGYQWGIGRYLYKLPQTWEAIKQQGKSYVLVKEPQLPAWALPTGTKQPNATPLPTQPSKESVNWVKFWQAVGDLGFKKEDVLHIAKTADISKYTNEDCKKLYAQLQMKKAQLEASAGKELTPEELGEQIRSAETLKDVP